MTHKQWITGQLIAGGHVSLNDKESRDAAYQIASQICEDLGMEPHYEITVSACLCRGNDTIPVVISSHHILQVATRSA